MHVINFNKLLHGEKQSYNQFDIHHCCQTRIHKKIFNLTIAAVFHWLNKVPIPVCLEERDKTRKSGAAVAVMAEQTNPDKMLSETFVRRKSFTELDTKKIDI